MFSTEQNKELEAPLKQSNVKARKQGGRQVSYIEGWWAIHEANRIFGFDGWSRETIDMRVVVESDRTIGESKAPGFGVSYVARVRIAVAGVIREGCGTGHGIDRDLGQAHESALKEAETDAMKRALMSFGNQFGLALYDKTQEEVVDDTKPPPKPFSPAHDFKPQAASKPLPADLDGLKREGMEAAEGGSAVLYAFWKRLPRDTQMLLVAYKDNSLKPIAEKADRAAA